MPDHFSVAKVCALFIIGFTLGKIIDNIMVRVINRFKTIAPIFLPIHVALIIYVAHFASKIGGYTYHEMLIMLSGMYNGHRQAFDMY